MSRTTGRTKAVPERQVAANGVTRRKLLGVGAGAATALWGLSPTLPRAAAVESLEPAEALATGLYDNFAALAMSEDAALAFARAKSVGAQTLRFFVRWDEVQPRPAVWEWSSCDAVCRPAAAHGLKVLPVVIGSPAWLGSSETTMTSEGFGYPSGSLALNAFGEFVVAALDRITLNDVDVEAIEIWSEPNDSRGAFIAEPAAYSRILATAALYVDAANNAGRYRTRKTVVSGGLRAEAGQTEWLDYLAEIDSPYFHYDLGLHIVADAQVESSTSAAYGDRIADEVVRAFDAAAEASQRPVWVTATGASSASKWGEDGQAEALGAVTARLAAQEQCMSIIVCPVHSEDGIADDQSSYAGAFSPLLRSDWSVTPAFRRLESAWATR